MIYFWIYLGLGVITLGCLFYKLWEGDFGELKIVNWKQFKDTIFVISFTIILWWLILLFALFEKLGVFDYFALKKELRPLIEKYTFDLYEYNQSKNEERIKNFMEELYENKEFKNFLNKEFKIKISINFKTPLNPKITIKLRNKVPIGLKFKNGKFSGKFSGKLSENYIHILTE